MKIFVIGLVSLVLFIVAMAGQSIAKIYKYKNEKGGISFTDDQTKIPEGNKENVETIGGDAKSPYQKISLINNHVIVPVKITYKGKTVEAKLLLDTGASCCTINHDIANRLEIKDENTKFGIAQVPGGILLPFDKIVVDAIEAGPSRRSNVEVGIMQTGSNFDGLLGINYLNEFNYKINISDQSITWF